MNPNSEDSLNQTHATGAPCTWADEHWQTFYLDAPIGETIEPSPAIAPPTATDSLDANPFLSAIHELDQQDSSTETAHSGAVATSGEGEILEAVELVETAAALLQESTTIDAANQTTIEVIDLVEASAITTLEPIGVSSELSEWEESRSENSDEQPEGWTPERTLEDATANAELASEPPESLDSPAVPPSPTRLASLTWMTWDNMMQTVAKAPPPRDGDPPPTFGNTRAVALTWSTWGQVVGEPPIAPADPASDPASPDLPSDTIPPEDA